MSGKKPSKIKTQTTNDFRCLTKFSNFRTEEQNTALSALPKSQCNVEKSVLNPMADEFVPLCHQIDFIAS